MDPYSTTLSDLPPDSQERVVVNIGPVSRSGPGSTEPIWTIGLRNRDENSQPLSESTYQEIPAAAGVLHSLPIGSTWKAQKAKDPFGPWPSQKIKIDASGQRLIWREEYDPIFVRPTPTRNAIPCIEVPLAGHPHGFTAVVRCSEIIRFFFGRPPVLVRHIFDFSDGVNVNEHLFVSGRTKISADQVVIRPAKRLTSDVYATFIGALLGHGPSARSLAEIASSARHAHQNGKPVLPHASIPIEGVVQWEVLATMRPIYELDGSEVICCRQALMISNIQTSWDMPLWPNDVIVDSDSRVSKPPGNQNPQTISSAETIRDDVQITSTELPGAHASIASEVLQDLFGSRPNMQTPKGTVRHQPTSSDERESIRLAGTAEQLSQVSALDGSGGASNIGSMSAGAESIAADHEVGEDDELEPKDRSLLPSIFKDTGLTLPEVLVTAWPDVPPEFRPFISAGHELKGRLKHLRSVDFLGQAASDAGTSPRLLHLPAEWGKIVECSESITGRRRALAMRLKFDYAVFLLLNIERRASEMGRLGPCSFISLEGLTPAFTANVLKWRLDMNEGWPNRSTHNGDFYSRRLKHPAATKTAIKKTVNKLEEAVDILGRKIGRPGLGGFIA